MNTELRFRLAKEDDEGVYLCDPMPIVIEFLGSDAKWHRDHEAESLLRLAESWQPIQGVTPVSEIEWVEDVPS